MNSSWSRSQDTVSSARLSPAPQTSALDDLYWQDEILQVMFWLLGEGFADNVTVADLRRFLDSDPLRLAENLDRLAEMNLVSRVADSYSLTDRGQEEAQRRFVEEFRPLLGRTGHGACSDDCWCHDPDHAGEECPPTVHAHAEAS